MVSPTNRFYEFGPFRLDAVRRLLLREGTPVPLTPKAFDTLLALVENSDRPLDKRELMEMLWPDSAVEERNLTVNVSALRKALGESASDHRYIVTIPGQGYRFVSNVRSLEAESGGIIVERHSRSRISIQENEPGELREARPSFRTLIRARSRRIVASSRRTFAVVFLLAVVAAVGAYLWISTKSSKAGTARGTRSIAVLPFVCADSSDEYLGLSLTDSLSRRLREIRQLTVCSTNPLSKLNSAGPDNVSLGQRLGVQSVLEGVLKRSGDGVSVEVRLISVPTGEPLWEETFAGNPANAFQLHDSVTRHLISALGLTPTTQEELLLRRRYTESIEAYEEYLRGVTLWSDRTNEGLHQSFLHLERAIEKDPNFALAYAGLANAYAFDVRLWPKAQEMARKALELDDTLGEPHATLGFIRMFWQWNWDEAEREFRQAIALNPNYATAHHWYGLYFGVLGGASGGKSLAIMEMEQALKLDPLSPVINADLGQVLYFAGQYDEAIAACLKAIEIDPGFLNAHLYLYDIYTEKGLYKEAVQKHFELAKLPGGFAHSDSAALDEIAKAYETEGIRGFWKQRIKTLSNPRQRPPNGYAVARYYQRLGNKERALYWLEEAFRNRLLNLVYVKSDPVFEPLWKDARFINLLRRMNMVS